MESTTRVRKHQKLKQATYEDLWVALILNGVKAMFRYPKFVEKEGRKIGNRLEQIQQEQAKARGQEEG